MWSFPGPGTLPSYNGRVKPAGFCPSTVLWSFGRKTSSSWIDLCESFASWIASIYKNSQHLRKIFISFAGRFSKVLTVGILTPPGRSPIESFGLFVNISNGSPHWWVMLTSPIIVEMALENERDVTPPKSGSILAPNHKGGTVGVENPKDHFRYIRQVLNSMLNLNLLMILSELFSICSIMRIRTELFSMFLISELKQWIVIMGGTRNGC